MVPVPLYLLAFAFLMAAGALFGLFAFAAEKLRGAGPRRETPEKWGAMS